jgi:hypothetical protein
VADLIAGGGIDGRSAIREAKCARVGNLAASPTSASSRAAPDGPIPCRSVNVVPVAASSAVSSLLAALLRWQLRSRSLISSGATRRRALPAASRGRTRASSALAWAADRLLWAPPGMSPGQQLVQLGDHPGVVFAQRPAAVGQDPQHRQLLVIGDLAQPGHPGSGQGDRMRVGGVGLAALPGSKDPGAGGQPGRHIHDPLAPGQQPAGDVPADALAAQDRIWAMRLDFITLSDPEHRGERAQRRTDRRISLIQRRPRRLSNVTGLAVWEGGISSHAPRFCG